MILANGQHSISTLMQYKVQYFMTPPKPNKLAQMYEQQFLD